jgi:hypothetical protein
LKRNLKKYYEIDNLDSPITGIVVTYFYIYFLPIILIFFSNKGFTLENLDGTLKTVYFILIASLLFFFISWVIQYIRLARRLMEYKNLQKIRRLGIWYYLFPFMSIGIIVFNQIESLKQFKDVFIIFEFTPLYIAFLIYREIASSRKQEISQ